MARSSKEQLERIEELVYQALVGLGKNPRSPLPSVRRIKPVVRFDLSGGDFSSAQIQGALDRLIRAGRVGVTESRLGNGRKYYQALTEEKRVEIAEATRQREETWALEARIQKALGLEDEDEGDVSCLPLGRIQLSKKAAEALIALLKV